MTSPRSSVLADTARAQRRVAPLMAAAIVSLLAGVWAGLARIGWALPAADGDLMMRHGALMVVGFAGTVIAAERAVAIRSVPAFAAPAMSALCGLSLVLGAPAAWPPALAAAAAVAYAVNMATLLIRHRALPAAIMLAGSCCLVVAAIAWWTAAGLPRVVPWWIAFLALTIGAERLELLRFQRVEGIARLSGVASIALVVLGPAVGLADAQAGARLLGAGLVVAAVWLLLRDGARRTVRSTGVTRFIAVGLLSAYAWLAVSGALLLAWGMPPAGFAYDAVLHAFFIGVVFGSIIAHEPIIAPSVGGFGFRYSALLYAPLALLDAGLVLRIAADMAASGEARRWAGLLQSVAILALLGVSARSILLARLDAVREMREARGG
ncbi:MAG: hypothetical protein WC273_00040 [Dehalococcoidia bacterium]